VIKPPISLVNRGFLFASFKAITYKNQDILVGFVRHASIVVLILLITHSKEIM